MAEIYRTLIGPDLEIVIKRRAGDDVAEPASSSSPEVDPIDNIRRKAVLDFLCDTTRVIGVKLSKFNFPASFLDLAIELEQAGKERKHVLHKLKKIRRAKGTASGYRIVD